MLRVGEKHRLIGEFCRVAVWGRVLPRKHGVVLAASLDPLGNRSFELFSVLMSTLPAPLAFGGTSVAGSKTADDALIALGILAKEVKFRTR